MRQVIFYESPEVINEQSMLSRHTYMLDGYEEWKSDMRKYSVSMKNSDCKYSRYKTHLLYEQVKGFPFVGFFSSNTHKTEKVCRIIWDFVYSDVPEMQTNKIELFEENLQNQFYRQIQNVEKEGNVPIIVYVKHACIDYHDNPNGLPIPELDKYLTAFEENYKKHHKGRLPDSLNFLDRVLMICQRIL